MRLHLSWILLTTIACSCNPHDAHQPRSLRVATETHPESLDPREARSLAEATALNALYEGLMRFTPDGQLAAGVAQSVDVSEDRRTYTFHLRDALWSNGKPLTAHDFVQSWRSELNPSFPAPNAFMLFPIQFARAAKAGKVPVESIGVAARDDKTLEVTLEQPTPYFLQLTAFYALFPVYVSDTHVTNGPFRIQQDSPNEGLKLVKNDLYWNADSIHLDAITLTKLDGNTALGLVENGELDWTGSPLSTIPSEAYNTLEADHKLASVPAAATHWFRFNVEKPPLSHPKVRRALALAINRQELVENVIQGHQRPAMSIVPSYGADKAIDYFRDDDRATARRLLAEGLAELSLSQFPSVTLIYSNTDRHHKIAQAVQQQWKKTLGIDIAIQALESKLFYDKLKGQDYQIANGSWFADYDDPSNFLEVFASKSNGTNNTGWEHSQFQQLLQEGATQGDPKRRMAMLKEAEKILMAEMPVAPLFFYSLSYVKSPRVEGVGITPTGVQIFRDGLLADKTP